MRKAIRKETKMAPKQEWNNRLVDLAKTSSDYTLVS